MRLGFIWLAIACVPMWKPRTKSWSKWSRSPSGSFVIVVRQWTLTEQECAMRAKSMIVFVTTVALTAGPTAHANAFSGGVSHVVTHPVALTAGAIMANPVRSLQQLPSPGIMRAQTRIVPSSPWAGDTRNRSFPGEWHEWKHEAR